MTQTDPNRGRLHRPTLVSLAAGAAIVALIATLLMRVIGHTEDVDQGPSNPLSPVGAAPLSTTRGAQPTVAEPDGVCGGASLLGPSNPPPGSVAVALGVDLATITEEEPGGTVFWLEPGTHRLGDGEFEQVIPKDGNRYVGAPGAVLDGRHRNQYAFGGHARGVTIDHLTIRDFGRPGTNNNEGVVNHDGASGWTMSHLTVRGNAGAGILMGSANTVESSCLLDNGQYGFSAYSPDGVRGITVQGNEIAGNNTDDWEAREPGCGCTGGGKFWATVGGVVSGNYVHDNHGTGLWADTNNAGFTFSGNHFFDNDGPALVYETSYNASITGNTFVRNGLRSWRDNLGFPTGAVYISESGSDVRVDSDHADVFEISGNVFVDNWGGVVAWENSDRFAGSPANTSSGASTLVNVRATLEACSDRGVVRRAPFRDDCRWKTQHLRVHGNIFRFSPAALGPDCTAEHMCGYTGVFANFGSYPDWSPYLGTVVERAITFDQDNRWSDNSYSGPWRFMAMEQGQSLTWEEWRAAPFLQDPRSTLDPTAAAG